MAGTFPTRGVWRRPGLRLVDLFVFAALLALLFGLLRLAPAPSGPVPGCGTARRSRRDPLFTGRTRSMACRWARVRTQADALPRAGSNRDAARQTSSSASCATRSD